MFRGYYEVRINNISVKKLLYKLSIYKIRFYKLYTYNNSIYLYLDKNNYYNLLKIKTLSSIEFIDLKGIYKIKDIIKRNYILFIFLFIGYIYINILSNIVFDIKVIHSSAEIRNIVYGELKNNGISKYSFFKDYNTKEKIKKKILDNNKDKLEWIEIERSGVKYIVRVEERIIKNKNKTSKPRNIIASKDGFLLKIEASTGEIIKKKGDYVKKGDIIISGNITKNGDIKNKVAATGNAYAEVWYKVTVNIPFYYKEVIYTGKKRRAIKINFLDKNFYIFNKKKYKTYKNNDIFSLNNSLIPLSLNFSIEEQTIINEKKYKYEEALNEARKVSSERFINNFGLNEKILKNRVINSSLYENGVEVTIFYKIYENITDYQELE